MTKLEIIEFLKKESQKRNISEKDIESRIFKIEKSNNVKLVNYGKVCWSIEDEDLNEVIIDEDVLNEMID